MDTQDAPEHAITAASLGGPASRVAGLAEGFGFRIADAIVEPARDEVRQPLPDRYREGAAGRFVAAKLGEGVEPWRHQSLALAALAEGSDVALTTPTASGKSLVFQAHAIDAIERDGRVIVLYPIKALASDQMRSWRRAVDSAGLPKDWVGEITGDVPVPLRKDIVASARILAMTPDVLHAWMMGALAERDVRSFLAKTTFVVLDEAHVLDAAFGSSVAFLLRRLQVVTDACRAKRRVEAPPLTYFASSATMLDPVAHLGTLTGRRLVHVGEEQDGSPRRGRTVMHLVRESEPFEGVSALQRGMAREGSDPFITFADSRKAVEILAMEAGEGIMPYRNGYEAADRLRIEAGLRDGALKGVVATSALEMGIDMGRLTAGLNLGAHATRRSIRQRIGRVGRAEEGTFAVVTEEGAFAAYGDSFRDYVTGPVEPSHLYTGNRYLQYQHARCLHAELEALGVRRSGAPPRGVTWPEGFAEVFAAANPDRAPPAAFADVHRLDGGRPHLDYALRSIGENAFTIETVKGQRIGSISRANALKEAYPDGTYLHLGRRYAVAGWKPGRFGPKIVVRPGATALTKPIVRSYVNGSLDAEGLVEGRTRGGGDAFVAEARLVVKESVVGFTRAGGPKGEGGKVMYAPGGARNRNLRTTGVLVRIPVLEGMPIERRRIAMAIVDRYCRAHGIAPADVGAAVDGVTVRQGSRMALLRDTIAFYDTTHGSLRLSRNLFEDMPGLVAGLDSTALGEEINPEVLRSLSRWASGLDRACGPLFTVSAQDALEAYDPGTPALRRKEGREDQAVELVEPILVRRQGETTLGYIYRDGSEVGFVSTGEIAFAGPEPACRPWCPDEGFEIDGPSPTRP